MDKREVSENEYLEYTKERLFLLQCQYMSVGHAANRSGDSSLAVSKYREAYRTEQRIKRIEAEQSSKDMPEVEEVQDAIRFVAIITSNFPPIPHNLRDNRALDEFLSERNACLSIFLPNHLVQAIHIHDSDEVIGYLFRGNNDYK